MASTSRKRSGAAPADDTAQAPVTVIRTEADVARGLQDLLAAHPHLVPIAETAGEVPLRLRAPGFEGLARIVVSQQLSVASAAAIWDRLTAALDPLTAESVTAATDETLRGVGLSRPKVRTLRAVSEAVDGGLDLTGLCALPAAEAHGHLCAVKGIGPWTADIYLLFCAGHPDIFPAGDLALQVAVADALALEARPSTAELQTLAADWAPWRGVAARLFWAYYRTRRQGRETLPV